MLERFKRTGSDRSPSGAVATSERAGDDETRTADDTEELNEAGAARAGDATRPTGPTGAANGDADTAAEDPLASEREARRRERESRRAGRTPRQDSAAGATMADDGTTGTAMRDDGTRRYGHARRRRPGRHGDARGPPRRGRPGGGATATVDGASGADHGRLTGDALKTARARQRDEFGGLNWGSSFFGWLVAVGIAALITGLLAAMGAAIGLTTTGRERRLARARRRHRAARRPDARLLLRRLRRRSDVALRRRPAGRGRVGHRLRGHRRARAARDHRRRQVQRPRPVEPPVDPGGLERAALRWLDRPRSRWSSARSWPPSSGASGANDTTAASTGPPSSTDGAEAHLSPARRVLSRRAKAAAIRRRRSAKAGRDCRGRRPVCGTRPRPDPVPTPRPFGETSLPHESHHHGRRP